MGLEIAHRKCLKQIATLSFYTDTTFTLTPLDMESAENIMDYYKRRFYRSITLQGQCFNFVLHFRFRARLSN